MRFTLEEVLQLTCARIVRWPWGGPGAGAPPLHPISDARDADLGALWFSMRGRELGPDLVASLVRAGAAGVVLFPGQPAPADARLGVLEVNSPALAYYKLAGEARKRSGAVVVGITGTAGKTSTKEYVRSLLQKRYRTVATESTFNQVSNCADILLQLDETGWAAAAIEMGFGAVGNIDAMGAMARPDAAVILNVAPDHFDGAPTMAVYAREKGKLGLYVPPDGLIVMGGEDPGCALIDRRRYRARVATFGFGAGHDAVCRDVTTGERGTTFTLVMGGQQVPIRLQQFGHVQAANAAAAALVGHAYGLTATEIQEGLAAVPPLPRRFVIHSFSQGLTLVDDAWHSTVPAMMRGLESAAHLAGGRRKVAVLGPMIQLEAQAEQLHREMGAYAVACGCSDLLVVGAGECAAWLRSGAIGAGLPPERVRIVEDVKAVPTELQPFMAPDTLIYCKAHREIGPELDAFRAAAARAGFLPRQ